MNRLQTIANLLTAAHELALQELERGSTPPRLEVHWMANSLQLALDQARAAAGFVPPATKKRGSK